MPSHIGTAVTLPPLSTCAQLLPAVSVVKRRDKGGTRTRLVQEGCSAELNQRCCGIAAGLLSVQRYAFGWHTCRSPAAWQPCRLQGSGCVCRLRAVDDVAVPLLGCVVAAACLPCTLHS